MAKFLDGYLHQDFRLEHRSPKAAAEAFAAAATRADVRAAADQLERFITSRAGRPKAEWQRALAAIGGAWRPASLESLNGVLEVLQASSA